MEIYTTHVGSFPLNYSKDNIKRIIIDLSNIGLDYPGYPQLRDFVEMYLDPLIRIGVLKPTKGGYKLCDLDELKREVLKVELQIEEAIILHKMYNENLIKCRGIKGSITGPFTLASRIFLSEIPSLYSSLLRNKDIVMNYLSRFVARYVEMLCKLNFDIVVIDEPILSLVVGKRILFNYSDNDLIMTINRIFEKIKPKFSGIHVCGVLSPRLSKILLSTNVNVLDHEHKDIPNNLKIYTREDLKKHNKFIAIGVVSSKNPEIETINEIKTRINEALNLFQDRLLFVKPDCGFRGLKTPGKEEEMYRISIIKLRNIIKALRDIMK